MWRCEPPTEAIQQGESAKSFRDKQSAIDYAVSQGWGVHLKGLVNQLAKGVSHVDIKEEFNSTPERPMWRVVVTTTRGRSYRANYAGDKPDPKKVEQDFLEDMQGSGRINWIPGN